MAKVLSNLELYLFADGMCLLLDGLKALRLKV